jgi:hypothetical protein
MKVKLFLENMWEFFLVFYFVPYKVNIPMHAGEFFYVFFVPYKVNIPMYSGGFKQVLYKEHICWIQVKINILDQTSLRICNSACAGQALPPPPHPHVRDAKRAGGGGGVAAGHLLTLAL